MASSHAKPRPKKRSPLAHEGQECSYFMVQKWSIEQLQEGLTHDFDVLKRNSVNIHYHARYDNCNERCHTVAKEDRNHG